MIIKLLHIFWIPFISRPQIILHKTSQFLFEIMSSVNLKLLTYDKLIFKLLIQTNVFFSELFNMCYICYENKQDQILNYKMQIKNKVTNHWYFCDIKMSSLHCKHLLIFCSGQPKTLFGPYRKQSKCKWPHIS